MKKVKFVVSHFEAGAEKFKAGEVYDVTEETSLCVARGAALEVDVDDEPASDGRAAETEAPKAEAKPAKAKK